MSLPAEAHQPKWPAIQPKCLAIAVQQKSLAIAALSFACPQIRGKN